jgi:hypothetical protein
VWRVPEWKIFDATEFLVHPFPSCLAHLLNGFIDGYLYDSGRIDTSLPYEELRRRSLINEAAQAADDAPDFSERIRASLPLRVH